MLSYERARIARRQTRRRVRKAGDRLTGTLIVDGGSVTSGASELVYGMTEVQAEELVSGAFTTLHLHSSGKGQRDTIRFDFGGDIGQQVSYSDMDVDLYFGAAMPRAGSITAVTVSVERPSIGGTTDFRLYRKVSCSPAAWLYIDGCHVVLPEGACSACVEFGIGTYVFSDCDEITVGALVLEAGMTRAQNGTVLVEASWS